METVGFPSAAGAPARAAVRTCSACAHWSRLSFGCGACGLAVERRLRAARTPVGPRAAIEAVGAGMTLPIAPACGDYRRGGHARRETTDGGDLRSAV